MKYVLSIGEQNLRAHIDIEKDIQDRKNGLFTFTLRVNNSNIVDYSEMEYIDASKYISIATAIITAVKSELSTSSGH